MGRVKMNDVAHVPQLSHNLISLPSMTLKGHTYTGDKGGVTLKLKGGETVFFPLVGKLCRQYGFRPEAAGSMEDTACTTIAPGKTKPPPPPLISTFSTARSATLTRYCSRRSSRESTQAGNFSSAGDVRWQGGCGSPSQGRRTPEQIPSASPALPQQLPSIAKEGESTAGEGASGEGASNLGGKRVQGLDSEFSLGNAAEVWPPVLPATREAPAAE